MDLKNDIWKSMVSFLSCGRFWRFDVKSRTEAASGWGENFVNFIIGLFSKSKKRRNHSKSSHYDEAISPRRKKELDDERKN